MLCECMYTCVECTPIDLYIRMCRHVYIPKGSNVVPFGVVYYNS